MGSVQAHFILNYMNKNEELFFKNLIVPEGIKFLYWNNKRYSKNDIIKIKQSFVSVSKCHHIYSGGFFFLTSNKYCLQAKTQEVGTLGYLIH